MSHTNHMTGAEGSIVGRDSINAMAQHRFRKQDIETHPASQVDVSTDGMITPKNQASVVDAAGYVSATAQVDDRVPYFLIPEPIATDVAPDLPASAVASLRDLAALSKGEGGVIYFTDYELLSCVSSYPKLCGITLVVILGYPSCLYSPEFKDVTFDLKSVSYNELLQDVISARLAQQAVAADARNTPEQRDLDTTRASGHKRAFDKFEVAQPKAPAHSDSVDGEVGDE